MNFYRLALAVVFVFFVGGSTLFAQELVGSERNDRAAVMRMFTQSSISPEQKAALAQQLMLTDKISIRQQAFSLKRQKFFNYYNMNFCFPGSHDLIGITINSENNIVARIRSNGVSGCADMLMTINPEKRIVLTEDIPETTIGPSKALGWSWSRFVSAE